MSGLRLALVTGRYWPHTSENASLVRHLADGLREAGCLPQVITPQRQRDWPNYLVHRETPVYRLSAASSEGRSAFRVARDTIRWFIDHADSFDLVYVFGMGIEAYAPAVAAQRANVPLMVRPTCGGAWGDGQWQARHRRGRRVRQRLQQADRVVVSSHCLEQELLHAGYSPTRLRLIRDGVPGPEPTPASELRQEARLALAEINHDLSVRDYAPVVVYCGPLEQGYNLHDLLSAWEFVTTAWPSAQLWLVGDGSERGALYEHALDLGIRSQVRMPGIFDDLREVLVAADLLVQPSPLPYPQVHVLEALRLRLPVVLADTPLHRELCGDSAGATFFQLGVRESLVAALREPIEDPGCAAARASLAGQRADEVFSLERMVAEHLALIEEVLAERVSTGS